MGGPVQDIRVLEIGDRGEPAGKMLADAGADVIRIEPPGGSVRRDMGPFPGDKPDRNACLSFLYNNANKRSVTLEVTKPAGLEIWKKLLATADIVIDSSGTGVLDKVGAGYETVDAPSKLIWTSFTPFGATGPWANWEANDLT